MNNNISLIINLLKSIYLNPKCTLEYNYDFELLIAARLSAQCTDKKVNSVTKKLFLTFKKLDDYADSKNLQKLKQIIKPCGLHNLKSSQISKMAKVLIQNYDYKIPNDLKNLLKLPGIGLKTANLILATIFNKDVIICDTHCIRISNRLNLVQTQNALLVEKILKNIIPLNEQTKFCHRLVEHGRNICKAKNPNCKICILKSYCTYIV